MSGVRFQAKRGNGQEKELGRREIILRSIDILLRIQ